MQPGLVSPVARSTSVDSPRSSGLEGSAGILNVSGKRPAVMLIFLNKIEA